MGLDLDTLIGKTIVQWVKKTDAWQAEGYQGFERLYLLFDDGFAVCIYPTKLIKDLIIYELSIGEKEEIFAEPYQEI